jgi:hypothetical protein
LWWPKTPFYGELKMPRFIRLFLFDHEEQVRDMLTLGVMLAGIAVTYMTLHFASTLTTDTNSNHYMTNQGLQEQIIERPYARQYLLVEHQ